MKELVNKIGDYGTRPCVCIQRGGNIVETASPDEIVKKFGVLKVCSFTAEGRGQLKIFIE